jgi:hypothetical protein
MQLNHHVTSQTTQESADTTQHIEPPATRNRLIELDRGIRVLNVAGRVVAVLGLSSEAQSGPWPDARPTSAPIPSGYDDSRAI